MRLTRLVMVGSMTVAAGCRNAYMTEGGACRPSATQVCMLGNAFSPSVRTVPAGTTVQWIDFSGKAHTVTSSPGSAQTFDVTVGPALGITSLQFNTPGTYHYYCRNHGAPTTGMRGTIEVK